MIAFVLTAALATTPITLEQVREQARRNTQALLAELEAARAGENIRTARSAVYPQLSLNAGVGGAYRGPQKQFFTAPVPQADGTIAYVPGSRDVPGASNGNFDLSFTVSQLIYDGGRWWTRIAQAGAQEEAARGQYQEQQLASEFEGVRRFYELFRAQQRQTVLEANERRSQDQVARAEGLFEVGRTSKVDLLSARVNLGNDRISVLQQRSRIVVAQAELASWLLHPATEELQAVAPAMGAELSSPRFDAALDAARKSRPLYQSLDAQVRSANLAITLARADYFPRVNAQVTAGRSGPTADPFFTDPARQNFVSGGVNLRWDLFNGFATDAQTAVAEAQRRTAEVNLAQALVELEADLKRAIVNVDVQQEATKIAKANRELAAESLLVAEGRFAQGAGSTLEVRDAQLKLTQAELTLLETQIDVEIARANLQRVLGGGVTQ